ncbi:MAG: hypothetical protein LBG62_00320 [Candidatus Methanoplasma sp.]|jgi:hypothetical protein|nr:hypothetical protein [Candidatus Methanoplasma sp.]
MLRLRIDASRFEYGTGEITAASVDPPFEATISVCDTGLICIEMDIGGKNDLTSDVAEQIYFLLKAMFHKDTHHFSSETRNTQSHIGESLGMTTESRSESIVMIADRFDKIINDRLAELSATIRKLPPFADTPGENLSDKLVHDQYSSVAGYAKYGLNFLRIFKADLPDSEERVRAMENCAAAIDVLYAIHCNSDMRALADETKCHTEEMKHLTGSMRKYSVLIPVAIFAATIATNIVFRFI